jgi:hypothetical protein
MRLGFLHGVEYLPLDAGDLEKSKGKEITIAAPAPQRGGKSSTSWKR